MLELLHLAPTLMTLQEIQMLCRALIDPGQTDLSRMPAAETAKISSQ